MVKVVAFAGPLTDAGEHGYAAMALGDVVDQFLDENRLTDAGTAEQADLAAARIGGEQVDDLDSGNEDRRFGRLVNEQRSLGVDRHGHVGADRAALVDRLADDVHDPAQRLGPDGNADLGAGVDDFLPAGEPVGAIHRDGAHGVLAEVLGNLEDERIGAVSGFERGQDRGQLALELHVDDGADDLADDAGRGLVEYGSGGHDLDPALGVGRLKRRTRFRDRRASIDHRRE